MKQAKWFLLLHVILGIYAGSSVCSKLAAQQPFLSAAFIVLYGLMLLALVTYAVGWQQVIKHLPLTTAYANKAVTVIWGMVWGVVAFHEHISLNQVAGSIIIILGIVLYSKAGEPESSQAEKVETQLEDDSADVRSKQTGEQEVKA